MREWLESIAGPAYATAMMWTLGALLLLLVVLLLIKIVRNLTFGTFVSGGRNRKARLAVMDAAAVDSHRRLVLVRRDDVEHLLLIGGPTDVVVEQNIRLSPQRRPVVEEPAREHAAEERPRTATVVPHPSAVPQPTPEPAAARVSPAARAPLHPPAAAPRPAPSPASAQPLPRQPAAPMPRPPSTPVAPMAPRPPAETPMSSPSAPASAVPPHAHVGTPVEPSPDLDDALREELEVTLDENKPRSDEELPESVEDEMSKLLGELSRSKR